MHRKRFLHLLFMRWVRELRLTRLLWGRSKRGSGAGGWRLCIRPQNAETVFKNCFCTVLQWVHQSKPHASDGDRGNAF